MITEEQIRSALAHTLEGVDFPWLGEKIEGKVRDCYRIGNKRILITSDRLSAFDNVLTTLPFKGQLLTELAVFWFDKTKDIVANHLKASPHPNVMVTEELEILPIEIVVRGYLAGSAWRDYQAGREISGHSLGQGLRKSEKLPTPLITPSTKAEKGMHDIPISRAEILKRGLVSKDTWDQVEEIALKLFHRGTEHADKQGLILVDTKYEFGLTLGEPENRKLVLADEIHTQDSSRYWLKDSYETRIHAGDDPEMLDKEFIRRWLIERGYMGDGEPPVFDDQIRIDATLRYIDAFERITGREFAPREFSIFDSSLEEQIATSLRSVL